MTKTISLYSGCPGVTFHAPTSQWQARIKIGKKEIYLGIRRNVNDAIVLRKEAERKYQHKEKGMNSKEIQKVNAVISILNQEASGVEALGEIEDNYNYWYKLGKAARLLTDILDKNK